MIVSFADTTTAELFAGRFGKPVFPFQIIRRARRKHAYLNAATSLADLARPGRGASNGLPPMIKRRALVPLPHPGETLLEDFLVPLGLSQVAFAKHLGVPVQRINEIVCSKRGVSAETAWLFAQAFGTSPEFWMKLQARHELVARKPKRKIPRMRRSA